MDPARFDPHAVVAEVIGGAASGLGRPPRSIVLVEGRSDQAALETLARRRDWDLVDRGVAVVPMGGAQALPRFLDRLGVGSASTRVAGLCDAHEERDVRRALARAGLRADLTRAEMEARGFFVCEVDLEDELIRALGPAAVEAIIAEQGELGTLRTFQRQPAQRGRPLVAQLRRFMGTRSGRKLQYATALVDALDLARVPRPLDAVLAHACT